MSAHNNLLPASAFPNGRGQLGAYLLGLAPPPPPSQQEIAVARMYHVLDQPNVPIVPVPINPSQDVEEDDPNEASDVDDVEVAVNEPGPAVVLPAEPVDNQHGEQYPWFLFYRCIQTSPNLI